MIGVATVIVTRLIQFSSSVLIILKFFGITMQLLSNCVLDMLACHWLMRNYYSNI